MNFNGGLNIDAYMKQVQRLPVPTREEEVELARRYRNGELKAGQELVARHLRFAVHVAHQYRHPGGPPFEDLVQEANEGLMRALKKFDPERGHRFCTYAVWWCRARVTLYIMYNYSLVRYGTTANERGLFRKAHAVLQKLRQVNPDLDEQELYELAGEELSVTAKELEAVAVRVSARDASLDAELPGSEGSHTRLDYLADPNAMSETNLISEEQRLELRALVEGAALNPKERFIVEKRLLATEPLTLRELGERFHLSRERVRQIEETVLHRLAARVTKTTPAPWRSYKDRKAAAERRAHPARRG